MWRQLEGRPRLREDDVRDMRVLHKRFGTTLIGPYARG